MSFVCSLIHFSWNDVELDESGVDAFDEHDYFRPLDRAKLIDGCLFITSWCKMCKSRMNYIRY